MSGLECGTFGLSKKLKENKSYVHVKLTDTALKAIEEYLTSRNKSIESPSVFFQGNEGELSIPKPGFGNTKFNFTLQDADQQGSFESIKQSADNLESLGPVVAKMKIAAKQTDSFQMTRDRMASETEKNSKKRARELEPLNQNPSNSFGRKRCRTTSAHTSNRRKPISTTIQPKEPLLFTKSSSTDSNSITSNPFGRRKCKPVTVTSSRRNLSSKTEIPAKVPLLSSNISSSDFNRNSQSSQHRSVTGGDSIACKQISHPPPVAIPSSVKSSSNKSETVTSSKRNLSSKAEIPAKITLLSSNISSSDFNRNSQSSQHKSVTGGDSIVCKQTSLPPIVPIPSSVKSSSINNYINNINSNSTSQSSPYIPHTVGASRACAQWEQLPPFDITSYRKSHLIDTSLGSPTDSYLKTNNSDNLMEYTITETLKQRRQYKNDFNLEYKTYLGLHEFLKTSNYIKMGQELNDILQKEKMGTKKYNKINKKIMRIYHASLDDKVFQHKKKEYDHVHKKLMYIKQLVKEIDAKLVAEYDAQKVW